MIMDMFFAGLRSFYKLTLESTITKKKRTHFDDFLREVQSQVLPLHS